MDKYEKIIGLAKRRGFLWNSFELYGGTAGFYDYGPLGAMLKRRIEDVCDRGGLCRTGTRPIFASDEGRVLGLVGGERVYLSEITTSDLGR
jgi:hypothetical protein